MSWDGDKTYTVARKVGKYFFINTCTYSTLFWLLKADLPNVFFKVNQERRGRRMRKRE